MLATNKYKNSEIIQNMEKINECYPLNNMSSQLNERYCKWKEIVSANIGIAKKIMEWNMNKVKWGIIGPGKIANRFADGLKETSTGD